MERLPQSIKQEGEREEKRKEKGSRLHHDSAEMSPLVLSPLLELARSSFGRRFLSWSRGRIEKPNPKGTLALDEKLPSRGKKS